jgi:hypothetical protein
MISRYASLFVAVATNLFLAGLFYNALTNPIDYTDFIYRTGMMIFVIEFMSLHSSGMFFGAAQEAEKKGVPALNTKTKIILVSFYCITVIAFAAETQQWLPVVYFVISLASKVVYSRSIDAQKQLAPVAAGIAMLLLSTFIVVFSATFLAEWFPFSAEVKAARPAGQSGLFVSTPQTLMVWGVLYFTFMTLCEIAIFRSSVHLSSAPDTDRAVITS